MDMDNHLLGSSWRVFRPLGWSDHLIKDVFVIHTICSFQI